MLDGLQFPVLVTHELTLSISDKSLVAARLRCHEQNEEGQTSEQHSHRHLGGRRWLEASFPQPVPDVDEGDREDDDPERIDRVGYNAGDFPRRVLVGPVGHRASVLVEHHPENDHDAINTSRAMILVGSGTCSIGVAIPGSEGCLP